MDREQDRFRRNERVTWRVLEGDCILLHLDSGVYYTLNQVGRFVWESLDGEKALPEIEKALLDLYAVDAEEVKKDVSELLKDLSKEDLIKRNG